jgi:hypothetical protein
MYRTLAMIAAVLVVVALALLLVRLTSRRSLSRQYVHRIPMQRSPLTQAEMVRLNQAYGEGRISEAEYARRRKELLSRSD